MAAASLFEANFKQTRINDALLLNRSGAKSLIPHCLRMGEGGMPGELASNLAKVFSGAQNLPAMLPASINGTAS